MRIRGSVVAAWLGLAIVHPWAPGWGQSTVPNLVTVCDVLSKPLAFDGMSVRIRGRMVGTDEGSWLKGFDCPGVMKTDGYVWDSLISLDLPGNPLQIHQVDFEHDFAADQRLEQKYQPLRRKLPDRCIAFTYTGVFETRKEWQRMMNGNPRGFGHLNAAPGALIIKSADEVAPVPGCH